MTKGRGKAVASKKMSCGGWKEIVFSVLLRLPFLSVKPAVPSS